MQFSMSAVTNATVEMQAADKYPNIRLFTVGQGTSSIVPFYDLQTIEQTWSVSSQQAVGGASTADPKFGYFSAVCWLFGKELFEKINVPIGLVNNNWGGTQVELWSPKSAFDACKREAPSGGNGALYNAMIVPYTVGPMALAGFTWYQGEANTVDASSAKEYACLFPAMITSWRSVFKIPSAYFGFVQLSTWCEDEGIAEMRDAQLKALELPNVGYGTNADHGAGCDIHPPPKQFCAHRLANSALALKYGKEIQWRSPEFVKFKATTKPVQLSTEELAADKDNFVASFSVEVQFDHLSPEGISLVYPANYIPGLDCAKLNAGFANTCGWAQLLVNNVWVNATASVGSDRTILTISADVTANTIASTNMLGVGEQLAVAGVSYGYAMIPMLTAYDSTTNLPILPFKSTNVDM